MNCLLLGHGFLAHALAKELHSRNIEVQDNKIPASHLTYDLVTAMINHRAPQLVINAAAYCPLPTVNECGKHPDDNIKGNVMLPAMLAHACRQLDVPLMHLSTGCLFDEQREYTEADTPTRGWDGYCGAYVSAKLLAEKAVLEHPESYVLRLRLPFDEVDNPRNYLSKLSRFETVYDHVNSLTHRGDFAKAAIDLWQKGVAWGIYHVVNPGQISAQDCMLKMFRERIINHQPPVTQCYESTGCRLSTDKLRKAGVIMRPVEEAVKEAIENWRK